MTDYLQGKNAIFLVDKGAGYVPHLCAVSVGITTNVETKEVMTTGDGVWRKPRQHRISYSIALEGVSPIPLDPADGYDAFNFLDNQVGFTNLDFRIYFEDETGTVLKMITGEALVTESNIIAGAEGLVDSTFTLEGFGAYQLFDSASACAAVLGTLTYSGQSPVNVILDYTGLSGGDRLEYSVDGTTRRDLVGMSASGSIIIVSGVGLVAGDHTVQVWPVCPNGEDGTPLSVNYTKT
jgi:hypothetical protein